MDDGVHINHTATRKGSRKTVQYKCREERVLNFKVINLGRVVFGTVSEASNRKIYMNKILYIFMYTRECRRLLSSRPAGRTTTMGSPYSPPPLFLLIHLLLVQSAASQSRFSVVYTRVIFSQTDIVNGHCLLATICMINNYIL